MHLPHSTAAVALAALNSSSHATHFQSASPPPLHSLTIKSTPNGFNSPARGWNSFGLQANPGTNPSFAFDESHVLQQCDIMASNSGLKANGFVYCSVDSGWSVGGNGDDYGRIIPDNSSFPGIQTGEMASHLHARGLKLGVYVVPGGFLQDVNKTILNTNIHIGDVCSGTNGLARCNWDFDANSDAVQRWHDSVVEQFARWGVDFIKLDFITPGSPQSGVNLPANESLVVAAYHTAISRSSRPMRLAISWKLDRDPSDFAIWSSNADSFRTDQDINNAGSNSASSTSWGTVQRAIDNYRQYIVLHTGQDEVLSIYPDMDNMFVANAGAISGVTNEQRRTILNHWMLAGSNLMLGSDLKNTDDFGRSLVSNTAAFSAIADFASKYPMRPRNPASGQGTAQQLQVWIAGPSPSAPTGNSTALVLLANYGPDLGQGGFQTSMTGSQTVSISLAELGIAGRSWNAKDVWNNKDLGVLKGNSAVLSRNLGEGESTVILLTKRV